jgi:hypothetical protein
MAARRKAPALPPVRESAIQSAAVDLLVMHDFAVVQHRQGSRPIADGMVPLGAETYARGLSAKKIRGYPDLEVFVGHGGVVWLESKSATGTLSPAQREWHALAKKVGLEVHTYRSALDALQICQAARARARRAAGACDGAVSVGI